MDLSVAASSFMLLFLAEMGDKTQVIAMTLAHRYRPLPVITGVLTAFLVLNGLAVLVGEALFYYVPQSLILMASGSLFWFFAYRSWQDSGVDDDETATPTGGYGAWIASFSLILLAELGDKSQLTMIALAAGTGDPAAVLLGGTLALWAVSLMGIVLGYTLLRRLPKVSIHRAAAALFFVFGVAAWVWVWRS